MEKYDMTVQPIEGGRIDFYRLYRGINEIAEHKDGSYDYYNYSGNDHQLNMKRLLEVINNLDYSNRAKTMLQLKSHIDNYDHNTGFDMNTGYYIPTATMTYVTQDENHGKTISIPDILKMVMKTI